jgi:hypothetical protein
MVPLIASGNWEPDEHPTPPRGEEELLPKAPAKVLHPGQKVIPFANINKDL